ncbi:MAG: cyclic nucleotide-binding domain-containing protein [Deltaproteobacteria bacterium HGW-Deltaproteobacteria-10]|nr:MAG: cyclic nucleotide-binding domain-containing protein [Deltaproteobacteria bacterium HGW-Deltaproteobacteria-10]
MITAIQSGLKRLDMTERRIAELLDETQWAKDFSWNQLFNLSGYFRVYRAVKGAELFHEGQREHSLGIIISGEIDIVKYDFQQKETVLARLRAGQTFGEMSLIDDEPRSATAMAVSDVMFLFISLDDFNRLGKEKAPLALALLWKISRQLSQRLRRTSGQLIEYLSGATPDE